MCSYSVSNTDLIKLKEAELKLQEVYDYNFGDYKMRRELAKLQTIIGKLQALQNTMQEKSGNIETITLDLAFPVSSDCRVKNTAYPFETETPVPFCPTPGNTPKVSFYQYMKTKYGKPTAYDKAYPDSFSPHKLFMCLKEIYKDLHSDNPDEQWANEFGNDTIETETGFDPFFYIFTEKWGVCYVCELAQLVACYAEYQRTLIDKSGNYVW